MAGGRVGDHAVEKRSPLHGLQPCCCWSSGYAGKARALDDSMVQTERVETIHHFWDSTFASYSIWVLWKDGFSLDLKRSSGKQKGGNSAVRPNSF